MNLGEAFNLKKLEFDDHHQIREFIKQYPPYNDFEFLSLWTYNIEGKNATSILNGNLVIKIQDFINGNFFYSLLGTNKLVETIKILIHQSQKDNLGSQLRLIPEVTILAEPKIHNFFSVKEDPDSFDYILSVEEIADMRGGKFREKRNLLKKFKDQYKNSSVEMLDFSKKVVFEKVMDLFLRWQTQKEKDPSETLIELTALKKLFDISKLLNIKGIGVYSNNLLIGFAAYHVVHDSYAIISFEKCDTQYRGIYEYVKNQLAIKLRSMGIKYINYEQDLGIAGLRNSKLKWRPIFFLKKYIIEEKC